MRRLTCYPALLYRRTISSTIVIVDQGNWLLYCFDDSSIGVISCLGGLLRFQALGTEKA